MSEENAMVQAVASPPATQWEDQISLAQRINRMLQVQREVMVKDVDYGIIPGCPKPSLLKPGAELLCTTFHVGDRMAPGYPRAEVDQNANITYTIVMEFYDQATGITIGQGMGIASTAEEKYAWRKMVCQAEFDNTEFFNRRIKYYKDGGTQNQIRTNPKDVENTVAKMAKKRAKVDGCLNVLAASRCFAQDLEDLPEGMEADEKKTSTKPRVGMPKAKTTTPPPADDSKKTAVISEAQTKRLFAICKEAQVDVEAFKNWLKEKMNLAWIGDIPKSHYEAICSKCKNDPRAFDEYAKPADEPQPPEAPAPQPGDDDAPY